MTSMWTAVSDRDYYDQSGDRDEEEEEERDEMSILVQTQTVIRLYAEGARAVIDNDRLERIEIGGQTMSEEEFTEGQMIERLEVRAAGLAALAEELRRRFGRHIPPTTETDAPF